MKTRQLFLLYNVFFLIWLCIVQAHIPIQIKRSIIEDFIYSDDKDEICMNKNSNELVTEPKLSAGPEPTTNIKEKVEDVKDLLFKRIKLPTFDSMKVGVKKTVILPGELEVNITVLSKSPLIFEVDNFIDEEDCELMIDLAKAKKLKPLKNKIADIQLNDAEQTFQQWDYNQDNMISAKEITLLPALSGIIFSEEDADNMFFLLKMDKDNDGVITLSEMKNTDFGKVRAYFKRVRSEKDRQRNISSEGVWLWHDGDELLRYQNEGYFEKYHQRVSVLTGIPTEVIEESEPFQVRHFTKGEFQVARHDSEPTTKDIPCCLYGDVKKLCRLCRYMSLHIFLNDVNEGGELVFPLANTKHQNILEHSGEWRGYYIFAKTTGNKFYFKLNITFTLEGANRVFTALGKDESGSFQLLHGIIIGETVKFEKVYDSEDSESNAVKYQGKLVDGSKISGYWWIPGQKRLRGSFFMWNRDYDIFSSQAIDESNTITGCPKSALAIKPKKGKAIFWYNHETNPRDGMVGELNQESIHSQCEFNNGDKWIATTWLNVIGDGDLTLRAWRRGSNLFDERDKKKKIFKMLGTNDEKLAHEPYEGEYLDEVLGNNHTSGDGLDGYYRHKPASNSLQALNLLFNDLNTEQLQLIAQNVHKKLGLTCIPLTVQHEGKISLVDGSVE